MNLNFSASPKPIIAWGIDLRRKNPYLYRAKNTVNGIDFIKAVLDATIFSGEETVFGNFLERIAIFVCAQVHGGRKSGIKGIDLEFEQDGAKYLVSIKSGPNWGNASQIRQLVTNFQQAKRTLATLGGGRALHVVCVEACCYGRDENPEKGTHRKPCGQRFWSLISAGAERLYMDIVEPLGHRAQARNEALVARYGAKQAELTRTLLERFCVAGRVDWNRLIAYNSGK